MPLLCNSTSIYPIHQPIHHAAHFKPHRLTFARPLFAPPNRNAFLKAIRTQNSLPDSIRELAICRVAVLNKAWFEWENHAPLLEATGVVAPGAVQLLRTKPANEAVGEDEGFDEPHAAVLEYVDAMTIGCIVPNAVFERTRKCFSEREVTELTATVSAYACVSRFLVALDVGEMAQKYGVDMD